MRAGGLTGFSESPAEMVGSGSLRYGPAGTPQWLAVAVWVAVCAERRSGWPARRLLSCGALAVISIGVSQLRRDLDGRGGEAAARPDFCGSPATSVGRKVEQVCGVRQALAIGQDGAVDDTTSRWEPESEEEYEAARTELKRRFAAWATRGDAVFDPDAPEGLLHYKWGNVDGHLTRWTRRDLDEIYLELYPAKVMAEPEELDEVLAEAAMFVTFLSETELLDEESEPADVLLDHLGRIEGLFRANMADTKRYSFGKRLWSQAAAEGVRIDDPEAVEAFMARFNARPRGERDAILGKGLQPGGRRGPAGRFTPAGTPPRPGSRKRPKRRR